MVLQLSVAHHVHSRHGPRNLLPDASFRTAIMVYPLPSVLSQNVFTAPTENISFLKCSSEFVKVEVVEEFLESVKECGIIGVAAQYDTRAHLRSLAFASETHVLVLFAIYKSRGALDGRRYVKQKSGWHLLQKVLGSEYPKAGFWLGRVALSLHQEHQLRIDHGMDLLMLHDMPNSTDAFLTALGGKDYTAHIDADAGRALLRRIESPDAKQATDEAAETLALEAWSACRAAKLVHIKDGKPLAPLISTKHFLSDVCGISNVCLVFLTVFNRNWIFWPTSTNARTAFILSSPSEKKTRSRMMPLRRKATLT